MPPLQSTNIPLAASSYDRNFAGSVRLRTLNRFFEEDPSSQTGYSLVARPGTSRVTSIGLGPTIRATHTQDGTFDNDLFVISGDSLYRYDGTTATLISGALAFTATFPSVTVQASPGVERLWVADGTDLFYYEGLSKSQAVLNLDAAGIIANDTVNIGSIYYKWVASGLDTGSPAGTLANPWNVLLGIDDANSLANLGEAIGNTGTPGSTYSTALTAHPDVEQRRIQATKLTVQAKVAGVAGDSIAVGETATALSWDKPDGTATTTLVNGGLHFLTRVELPEGTDDANALAVTTVSGFVIVGANTAQRIYYIFPGEFWVDTFAEAEAEPDQLIDVKAVGDLLWVFGTSTIEIWAATGDEASPFAPIQGQTLRFGAIRDTVVVLDGRVFYVDTSGVVRDGSGQRISTHTVEEKIRLRG